MVDKKIDHISVQELERRAGTMYKVAKVLGVSVVAAYKWRVKNKVPAKRIKSLMLLKPEWFEPEQEVKKDAISVN